METFNLKKARKTNPKDKTTKKMKRLRKVLKMEMKINSILKEIIHLCHEELSR